MMKHKCIDCDHCDIINMKCHPDDKDCLPEYTLTEHDLLTAERCDFYKQGNKYGT